MALIECPECGRKSVSDSAKTCPDCRFGINEYFMKLKFEEEQNMLSKELEKKEAEREKEQLETISMPPKPNIFFNIILAFIAFGLWGIGCLILPSPFNAIGFFLFMSVAVWFAVSSYRDSCERYNSALADFDKYQREELSRIELESSLKQYKMAMGPKCPMCGAANIMRMPNSSRAAARKIGKQYKCRICKHMW